MSGKQQRGGFTFKRKRDAKGASSLSQESQGARETEPEPQPTKRGRAAKAAVELRLGASVPAYPSTRLSADALHVKEGGTEGHRLQQLVHRVVNAELAQLRKVYDRHPQLLAVFERASERFVRKAGHAIEDAAAEEASSATFMENPKNARLRREEATLNALLDKFHAEEAAWRAAEEGVLGATSAAAKATQPPALVLAPADMELVQGAPTALSRQLPSEEALHTLRLWADELLGVVSQAEETAEAGEAEQRRLVSTLHRATFAAYPKVDDARALVRGPGAGT